MFKIDSDGHVSNEFTEGNPSIGQPATVVSAEWLNKTVQRELTNVVTGAGLTLSKPDDDQLLEAVNILIDEGSARSSSILSQAIINGNMQVSQRGNFTTAITSASGLANARFYHDHWKVGFHGSSLANASYQRITPVITGYPELTHAVKVVVNSSGGSITGDGQIYQLVEDFAPFKGKTISVSFWARSNVTSNVRIEIGDGVSYQSTAIDTNSGDLVWRHYHFTAPISSSASNLQMYFGIHGAGVTQVSLPAGAYFECTGFRLYEGTNELPALVRSYDDELQRCLRYCIGSNGERYFAAGYSIYNIGGVAYATWNGVGDDADIYFGNEALVNDVGAFGSSQFILAHPMKSSDAVTLNHYLFDLAANTAGGAGAAARVRTVDAAGVATDGVSVSAGTRATIFIVNQSTLIGDGRIGISAGCIEQESF